ncbi:hypothetical protein HK098_008040, partial [Nowakowskiella sp. JEL0407]
MSTEIDLVELDSNQNDFDDINMDTSDPIITDDEEIVLQTSTGLEDELIPLEKMSSWKDYLDSLNRSTSNQSYDNDSDSEADELETSQIGEIQFREVGIGSDRSSSLLQSSTVSSSDNVQQPIQPTQPSQVPHLDSLGVTNDDIDQAESETELFEIEKRLEEERKNLETRLKKLELRHKTEEKILKDIAAEKFTTAHLSRQNSSSDIQQRTRRRSSILGIKQRQRSSSVQSVQLISVDSTPNGLNDGKKDSSGSLKSRTLSVSSIEFPVKMKDAHRRSTTSPAGS